MAAVRGPFTTLVPIYAGALHWADARPPGHASDVGPDDPGPWLTGPLELPRIDDWKDPMETSDLHRRFARLKHTKGRILSFAETYGMLGHPPISESGEALASSWAESLHLWAREIWQMATLIEAWDLARSQYPGAGQYVHQDSRSREVLVALPSTAQGKLDPDEARRIWREVEAGTPFRQAIEQRRGRTRLMGNVLERSLLPYWEVGVASDPLTFYVCQQVNFRLDGHVGAAARPLPKTVRKDRPIGVIFIPDCLLAALYTHLLLELSGRTRPAVTCAHCGRLFAQPDARQRYCSKKCRQLACYYRHKEDDDG
ncbi:MAG: hypothetical protein HY691_15410 [Chloroflexi bacterium]|nr:hypothetical protein [Chloroflexota bacterium]